MRAINRRSALALLAGAADGSAAITREEAAYAAAQVAQAKPYALRFFTPREYATVVALSDLILPRDARSAERIGGRRAGVHRLHRRGAAGASDGDARRTGLARQRVPPALRQGVCRLHGRRTPAGRRRHRVARPRAAGDEPRRRILQRRCATSSRPASGRAGSASKISATWEIGRWRSLRFRRRFSRSSASASTDTTGACRRGRGFRSRTATSAPS